MVVLKAPAAAGSPKTTARGSMPIGVFSVVLLAGLVFAIGQGIVSPAIAPIAAHFHTTTDAAAWTLTGFLLSASVATPIIGKLGDLHGKGRVLSAILLIASVGSVISAVAPSVTVLTTGRVIQGVAGGVFPLAFGIVRDTFPRERVAMGISIVSAVFGIGAAAGLPLGGVLLAHAGLAWLFWIGLAAVPAAVGAFVFIPAPAPSERAHGRLDWTGAALLSAGLVAVLLAVSQGAAWGWTSPAVLGLLIGATALFAAWVAVQTRVREPLVDMTVFTRRPVALTNLATLIIGFAMLASFLLVPEFLETPTRAGYGFGTSATVAGLILVPVGAAMLVLSPVAGWLGPRIGFRRLLGAGGLFAAGGYVWMALAHTHEWDFIGGVSLLGIGFALAFSAMGNLIVDAVEPADVGIATGMNTIARTVGGAFGSAVTAAILAANTVGGTHLPDASGYTTAFLIVAAAAFVSALVALALPRTNTRPVPADAKPDALRATAHTVTPAD